jgi:hypothetical protein
VALNPFQQGQQFASAQAKRQLDLDAGRRREQGIAALASEFGETALAPAERTAIEGSERAERRAVSDAEQRILTNKRLAKSDADIEEDRVVAEAAAEAERKRIAQLRSVSLIEKVQASGGDLPALFQKLPQMHELLGLAPEQVGGLGQFIEENPDLVPGIKAALAKKGGKTNRRVVRTVEGQNAGEDARFFNVFSDGTIEEVSDVTPLKDRQLDLSEERNVIRRAPSQGAIAQARAEGKSRGELIAEGFPLSAPAIAKQLATFRTQKAGTDRTLTALKKAKKQAGFLSSGFIGGVTKAIPGTPAHDLEQTLLPAVSRAFVENLQNMREMSKTGGAVGNVSDAEGSRLAALDVSLEVGQQKEQMIASIDIMIEAIETSQKNLRAAFAEDQASRDALDEREASAVNSREDELSAKYNLGAQ